MGVKASRVKFKKRVRSQKASQKSKSESDFKKRVRCKKASQKSKSELGSNHSILWGGCGCFFEKNYLGFSLDKKKLFGFQFGKKKIIWVSVWIKKKYLGLGLTLFAPI